MDSGGIMWEGLTEINIRKHSSGIKKRLETKVCFSPFELDGWRKTRENHLTS